MPLDSSSPHRPAPTLIVSYASEDREAARKLRDALSAHDIDVWYDEDDLTGGDAWDQKIRRRIRECDYFMPVISQATQARREGYFRREWRQAAERTLDMADDVMFLLPVNISDIPEAGARVPERFQHVHWTRCPDGEPNADLEGLCHQVLTGEEAPSETPPTAAPSIPVSRKKVSLQPSKAKKDQALPPYPHQPHRTADEPVWLHVFNLMVWIVRCAYRAYQGFPRILRWVVIIWFITFLFSRNDDSDDSNRNARGPDDPTPTSEESAEGDDIKTGLLETAQELRNVEGFGEFGRIIGAVADAAQAGRPLVLTPFVYNSTEATNEEFTKRVFNQLLRSIRVTRADEVAVSPSALGVAPTSADILARISRTESRFLLTGWVEIEAADNSAHFELVLHSTDSPSLIWTQRYPVANTDAASIVDDILAALSTHDVFAPAAPPEDPEIPETLPEAVP